jgi:hypothetical protein
MRPRMMLASILLICAVPCAHAASKLDAAKIDAALGRSGSWAGGVYVVDFLRPNLRVMLQGVQLAAGQVDSFVTFAGTDDKAEMMGEVCALVGEVTTATEKLRAGRVEVTGIHNHFLGESPRLMFIHFMAHGQAAELARAFRVALSATTTPLGDVRPPKQVTPSPAWAKSVESALGRHTDYSTDYGYLSAVLPRADFPNGPMQDFWCSSALFFQEAPGGKIAATGDLAVTARELNPVLSALTEHHYQIIGVHNHMIDEQPRLFFVHFWKVGAPADLASGLKAALAVVKTR